MKTPHLNFAHLCDSAFLSKDNKLNIISIFRTLYGHKFPFRYPKITVVANVMVDKGAHPMAIQILKEGKEEPVLKMQGEIKAEGKRDFNLIVDFANIPFEDQRNFTVEILIDDEKIGELPFSVQLYPNQQQGVG